MAKSDFVHLHNHSHYSLLQGLSKIPNMVNRAQEYDMDALALTDYGSMYGAISFYKKCKDVGIKPILGVDAYMAARGMEDKEHGLDNKRFPFTLLAKNNNGYQTLMKLISQSYLKGFYYKPRMDKVLLKEMVTPGDLVCMSGPVYGEVGQAVLTKNFDRARELVQEYINIFGVENYYIELMFNEHIDGLREINRDLKQIAEDMGVQVVATQNSHYLDPDDREAFDTLITISATGVKKSADFMKGEFSFKKPAEMEKLFADYPEAIANTKKIADECNVELELGNWNFPKFEVPSGETHASYLRKKVYEGVERRYGELNDEIKERIDRELGVIEFKGFPVYMLIVGDLIDFARRSDIYTNIRGSVAGSIVTYLLGITTVDPLRFKLPFERFLNPERPTAPDIDMDFADNRRDDVLDYARQKYGVKAVAQIGTFGTMAARGSIRDVTRALGFGYDLGDKMSKMIPMGSQGFAMTIERALGIEPELKKMYKKDADAKRIIDMAQRIEGSARHISVHAAGVVISPTRVDDYTPVQMDPKGGKIITQYDMHAVEDAGLIKFDFLGIRNLAILGDAVRLVKQIHDKVIVLEEVPVDDAKTFKMLAEGKTMGVFQMAGDGMTRYLRELNPTKIDDLNAMVALYRPGPMEMIPEYIKRKQNPRLIKYLDPRMEKILDLSYGVITYQDDVMMIAIELAGYSWLEADKLRKAMGKKIPALMEEQKKKLMTGLLEHGLDQKKSDTLWSLIEPFAAYGFNKAHAASYGQVSYWTAYMKANYPVPYMTAILTAESGKTEKITEVIHECTKMGIEILPPDINESFNGFTVIETKADVTQDGGKIRFGLDTIKNFGHDIGQAIIDERKANGKFESMEDFLERIQHKNLTKKSLEALLMVGAMDSFGDRGKLIANMENLLAFNKSAKLQNTDQVSLFGGLASAPQAKLKLVDAEPATKDQKLLWEKELLGVYVSGHPLDKFREVFDKAKFNIKKIKESGREGVTLVAAGIIEECKVILTKAKQQKMAFVRLADMSGEIECVVFPKIYDEFKDLLETDATVMFKAKISDRDGERSLLVDKIKKLG